MNRRGSRSVSMQRERELSDKWCRTILSAVYLRCQASSSLQQRTIDMSSVLPIRNQLNEVTFLSTQDAAPTPAQKLASQQLLSSAAQLSVNLIAIISCVPPDHFHHRSTSRNPIPVIAIISYYPPNLPSDHPPALQWLTTPTTSIQLIRPTFLPMTAAVITSDTNASSSTALQSSSRMHLQINRVIHDSWPSVYLFTRFILLF